MNSADISNDDKEKTKISVVHDQHFLVDDVIVKLLADSAEITKSDIVLEIGAGKGIITKELAKKAKMVIALEIDERFREELETLPKNVHYEFCNAIKYLKNNEMREISKIVANIPFAICEPLMHFLLFKKHIKTTVLLVPKHFVQLAKENPIFSSFLKFDAMYEVDKHSFSPPPRTESMIVKITHRPSFEEDKDAAAFIARRLYMQEDKKLKNGLEEALIKLFEVQKKEPLTKKKAAEIVKSFELPAELLDSKIEIIGIKQLKAVLEKIRKVA